jgi:hypothetical protein
MASCSRTALCGMAVDGRDPSPPWASGRAGGETLGPPQSLDDRCALRPASGGDRLDVPPAFLGERQQRLPAVLRVGLPGEPGRGDPVRHPHRGRRRDLQQVGQCDQLDGATTGHHDEHAELRKRDPFLDVGERAGRDRHQHEERCEHRAGDRIDVIRFPGMRDTARSAGPCVVGTPQESSSPSRAAPGLRAGPGDPGLEAHALVMPAPGHDSCASSVTLL